MDLSAEYRRVMPYILAAYLMAVAAAFLYFNIRIKVEWVAIILFGAAILSGRALLFLKDWGVFILVLMAWQLASPLATMFSFPWHLQDLIDAERTLFFGQVPTLWLQAHLYHPGKIEPWDIFAATLYLLHFLTPLAAGFVIWLSSRELFGKFALAFVVVAVAGFATYIFYPAVPPWMAAWRLAHVHGQYMPSPHGHVYLPGVVNLFAIIASHWYNPYHGTISFAFLHTHYDNVGAVPSEHAAYPMLFFLFLRRRFGRIAYLSLIYIACVVFAIAYLGQHYVVDALVGFAYAICGYAVVMHLAPALSRYLRAAMSQRESPAVGGRELEEA